MLPLVLNRQLSTFGISKSMPLIMCKLIWSFVKEHNTAKIIKAAVYTLMGSANTPDVKDWVTMFFDSRSYYPHDDNHDWFLQDFADHYSHDDNYARFMQDFTQFILQGKLHSKNDNNLMKLKIDEGERHAPARPSGKCPTNPI